MTVELKETVDTFNLYLWFQFQATYRLLNISHFHLVAFSPFHIVAFSPSQLLTFSTSHLFILSPSHLLTFQVPSHWPLDTSHSPHTGTSQVKQYFLKKIKSDCWWWIFHIDDLISPRNKCQPYSRRHSVHIYWKYSSDQFIWYWLLRDLSGNFQQSFLAVALSLLAGSSVWLLEPCLRRWEDTIASKKIILVKEMVQSKSIFWRYGAACDQDKPSQVGWRGNADGMRIHDLW